jgi:hypothetical protein
MPTSTYEPIATTTIGSRTTSYTFSSIPQTYTDLRLILNLGSPATANLSVYPNNDSTNNCQYIYLASGGGATPVGRYSGSGGAVQPGYGLSWTGGDMHPNSTYARYDIFSYTNTSKYKAATSQFSDINTTQGGIMMVQHMWLSTAAITSLVVHTTSAELWEVGTVMTLYGIKAA